MVIIGLGSNVGYRLQHLKAALRALQQVPHVTVLVTAPVYQSKALMPEAAPAEWQQPFLNTAVAINTSLNPLQLLQQLKQLEQTLGRLPAARWAPRVIDLDILCWGEEVIDLPELQIPHQGLLDRPFALWPLLELLPDWQHPLFNSKMFTTLAQWGSSFTEQAPFQTRQTIWRIDTPELVGIVNLSPDSFSETGYSTEDLAIQAAIELWENGATVIDLGACSTKPGAITPSPEETIAKLKPVLKALQTYWQNQPEKPLISIDTHQVAVAEWAINQLVDWINDVSGFQEPAMQKLAQSSQVRCVLTHSLCVPTNPAVHWPLAAKPGELLRQFFLQQLEKLDIPKDRIILDPGLGFGKTPWQTRRLLHDLHQISAIGCKVLLGPSRKSIASWVKPLETADKDVETIAVLLALLSEEVDYWRVHRVDWLIHALSTYRQLRESLVGVRHEQIIQSV